LGCAWEKEVGIQSSLTPLKQFSVPIPYVISRKYADKTRARKACRPNSASIEEIYAKI
jgi:hypothetical protein